MKKFSELQDTKRMQLRIHVMLKPIFNHEPPVVSLLINGKTIYDKRQSPSSIGAVQHVGLLDPVCIEIELSDKDYHQDHTTAIEVTELSIEYFNLIPDYTHYARYINDHNFTDPTSHVGFNGIWQFFITEPFYQWRHHVTGQGWLLKP